MGYSASADYVHIEGLSGLSYEITQANHGLHSVSSVVALKATGEAISLAYSIDSENITFESLIPMDGLIARIS